MSEIRASKVSWATDMSPTATISSVLDGHDGCMLGVGGGVYPGWWGTGVGRRGAIPVPTQAPSQDPYLTYF